jgi:hypothetical protein
MDHDSGGAVALEKIVQEGLLPLSKLGLYLALHLALLQKLLQLSFSLT